VLVGDQGKLDWSLSGRSLRRFAGGASEPCESHDYAEFSRNRLFLDELEHFLSCVEDGHSPNVSLECGAESVAVALSILESQASGMPVNVGAVLERAGLHRPRSSRPPSAVGGAR
jgi:predicted dehydrogenase